MKVRPRKGAEVDLGTWVLTERERERERMCVCACVWLKGGGIGLWLS